MRFRSVYALNPSTPYFWKFTWGTGTEGRVSVKEDGADGPKRIGIRVGARSIYRNVWIGNHPRPTSLGSACDACADCHEARATPAPADPA